jgi:hypothetical protein
MKEITGEKFVSVKFTVSKILNCLAHSAFWITGKKKYIKPTDNKSQRDISAVPGGSFTDSSN